MSDLISREAAIAYSISGMTREIDGEKWIRVSEVRESIKTMPTAESVGKWIVVKDKWGGLEIRCSECGAHVPRDEWGNAMQCDYCPNCGARMDEVTE